MRVVPDAPGNECGPWYRGRGAPWVGGLVLAALACSSKPPPGVVPTDGPSGGLDRMVLEDAPVLPPPPDASEEDIEPSDAAPRDAPPPGPPFCQQGSDVPGVSVPAGFCLRRFGTVRVARTLVIAPNGDLFVGAPSDSTAGGASGGPGAIVVLSDDNHDGVSEAHTFASGIRDVHGLALGGGFVYFTTTSTVWRTPYSTGQRRETGPREDMGLAPRFGLGGRWTHGLARSVGGELLASRGEYNSCGLNPVGEILRVSMGAFTTLARGFRNPMYMRCHSRDEVCAATELGEDQTPGAREKLVIVKPNTNYGYPCCFTTARPIHAAEAPKCPGVTREDAEFVLAETPFGLDWEREIWPAPYRGGLFVALHGSFYTSPSWGGARIVYARTDPVTRAPVEGWQDFLGRKDSGPGGFGPGGTMLERPSDVAFAPDGRMFFSDDQGGGVYWMAPLTLPRPL